MNVVTQSWIIENLTIGCEKIANSRQHSEPIEYEELGRQLRQRSRGKEGKARFANEGTFAFCLRFFWVPLWMLESEVREWAFFIFWSLSWILKRYCLTMSQLSKYGSTWPNKWLWQMLLSCRARCHRVNYSCACEDTNFKVLSAPRGETKAEIAQTYAKAGNSLCARICLSLVMFSIAIIQR